ncbi:class I SAM-dependent methyltransferase [bacterium]|nr:class I SAM-dependent methyltransferase [bacterium]
MKIDYKNEIENSRVLKKRVNPAHLKKQIIVEKRRAEKIMNLLAKKLKGLKVLDVGCGLGTLVNMLTQEGADVVGVDINLTGRQIFEINIQQMDFNKEPLPFQDAAFDIVICADVLEHTFYPKKLLAEISRVLKKTGEVIISYPNEYNIENRLKVLLGLQLGVSHSIDSYAHHFFVPPKLFKKFLNQRFKIIATSKLFFSWKTLVLKPLIGLKPILPFLFVESVIIKGNKRNA